MNNLFSKPKNIFLVDGFGALLSAFLLGVVLMKYQSVFGIPKSTLLILALLPCLFALYDFTCFFKTPRNTSVAIKIIVWLNIAYCILSICLALLHRTEITILGWVYIVLEIIIVLTIIRFEMKFISNK